MPLASWFGGRLFRRVSSRSFQRVIARGVSFSRDKVSKYISAGNAPAILGGSAGPEREDDHYKIPGPLA